MRAFVRSFVRRLRTGMWNDARRMRRMAMKHELRMVNVASGFGFEGLF